MSISFVEDKDKVVDVLKTYTATIGNIAYSVEHDWVFAPDCNWLTAQDMFVIAQELEKRNNNENHL